ncbi:MAG: VOC family protein [Smithella sp.]
MKFGHIGVEALNLKESIEFYKNILSAKVVKDYVYPDMNMRLVFLEAGGTIFELVEKPGIVERTNVGPLDHIAFKVDSLDDEMKMLDKYNIKYTEPRIVGNARIIFFNGPNHESFEFVARV